MLGFRDISVNYGVSRVNGIVNCGTVDIYVCKKKQGCQIENISQRDPIFAGLIYRI